jgi:PadR family transcriptional regulator, regulatory protein PadR
MPHTIGRFQEAILATLVAAKGEATMAEIFEGLAAKGKQTTLGAICNTLDRMAAQNLVTRYKGDARPIRGGRSRYFYKITNAGRAAVIEAQHAAAPFVLPLPARNLIAG